MDALNLIFNAQTLISALIGGMTGAAALYGILRFIYRKEIRLFNNAKRPIMIFKCDGMNMEIETQMLRDIGFFNINEQPCWCCARSSQAALCRPRHAQAKNTQFVAWSLRD